MNTDPSQVIDLSNVQNPFTLVFLGLIVGAIVRILRTKKIGDWLDATSPSWVKRIPKAYLPWVANGLAVLIAYADLTLNAHMNWKAAIVPSLMGVFGGSLAISGHETVAKVIGKALYKPDGPVDPKGPLGPDDPTLDPADEKKLAEAPKVERRMPRWLLASFVSVLLLGCTPRREAAITNLSRDKAVCAANLIGRPVEEILVRCAGGITGDDLKNFKDIIFGMKEGAAAYGANIPDAPPLGTYLPPRDAGVDAR